jgi:DNA-binding transcriptional ArsR family regulator
MRPATRAIRPAETANPPSHLAKPPTNPAITPPDKIIQFALAYATVWLHNVFAIMKRDVFQAIADPTRRAIIALVALQAMTPNALAEHFDTTRQAVSKHLRILTECEVVTTEQRGREIYYRLEIDKMKEIDEWLEQYRQIWETRYEQLDALLAELKQKENRRMT